MLERFAGTWSLVRYEFRRANGQLTLPFGEDPAGLLIYDAIGNMSGQVMRRGRRRFAAPVPSGGADAEIREAFEGYIAYFGRYRVDPEAGTVTHYVEGSWFPNFAGSEQVRYFEFDGGRLLLRTPPRNSGAERRTALLVWERVRAQPAFSE